MPQPRPNTARTPRADKAVVPGAQREAQYAPQQPSRGETTYFFPQGNVTVTARSLEEAERRYHEIIQSRKIETQ